MILYSWTKCAIVEPEFLQCSIAEPDIVAKKHYHFRVAAENAAGVGKASPPTPLITVEDPLGKSTFHNVYPKKFMKFIFLKDKRNIYVELMRGSTS